MRVPAICALVVLSGCNVVPPLDCVMGVERPGCHRDANGMYHYLYTSPMVPAPNADAVPVAVTPYVAPAPYLLPMQAPYPPPHQPSTTSCYTNFIGNSAYTSCY